jgi:hypothetical protein
MGNCVICCKDKNLLENKSIVMYIGREHHKVPKNSNAAANLRKAAGVRLSCSELTAF